MENRFLLLLLTGAFLLVGTGCSERASYLSVEHLNEFVESDETVLFHARNDYHRGNYPQSITLLEQLSKKTTENQTLFLNELGTAYLASHRKTDARRSFIKAYRYIASNSDKSGPDTNKSYQGLPYEQATLNLLLGLIALEEGDFAMALEYFKTGQLADAGSKAQDSDYGLLQLMEAQTYLFLGEKEKYNESYEQAISSFVSESPEETGLKSSRESLKNEFLKPHNVLVLVWLGEAPVMVRSGEFGEERFFVKNPWPARRIDISVDDSQSQSAKAYANISYQATTNAGILQDNVFEDLADFKSRSRKLGQGSFQLARDASYLSYTPGGAFVYLSSFTIGLIAHSLSSSTEIQPDIRCWRSLPDKIAVIPLKLEAGRHNILIDSYNKNDHRVSIEREVVVEEKPFQFFNLVFPAIQPGADVAQQ